MNDNISVLNFKLYDKSSNIIIDTKNMIKNTYGIRTVFVFKDVLINGDNLELQYIKKDKIDDTLIYLEYKVIKLDVIEFDKIKNFVLDSLSKEIRNNLHEYTLKNDNLNEKGLSFKKNNIILNIDMSVVADKKQKDLFIELLLFDQMLFDKYSLAQNKSPVT